MSTQMATIERDSFTRRHLCLIHDNGSILASEEIPASGKTLQIEVKLYNLARELNLKVRKF
jgi:hypothetical protein